MSNYYNKHKSIGAAMAQGKPKAKPTTPQVVKPTPSREHKYQRAKDYTTYKP